MYPSLVCVKLGALQTLQQCPSQYKGHQNRFHSDYESNYPEIAPAQRPVSVILALDPFDFMYLPHITQKRKDIVHLTVPAGHAIIFTDACPVLLDVVFKITLVPVFVVNDVHRIIESYAPRHTGCAADRRIIINEEGGGHRVHDQSMASEPGRKPAE